MAIDELMTIGQLASRTGASIQALRRCTELGLVYTMGRSPANYRLYDESAVWCVQVIGNLRRLLGTGYAEVAMLGVACEPAQNRQYTDREVLLHLGQALPPGAPPQLAGRAVRGES